MYRPFYGLKLKPFQISTDPAFLWHGEKHREALATLKYGIQDNKGFLLLTGDVGTGKTTLIHTLINSLGEDIIHATVLDPGLEKLDFFNFIAQAFHMGRTFETKGAFLVQFNIFLNRAYEEGKKVLLIIDESQMLTQELLEEIRLLSNIEKQSTKLVNIFFVGQNEFNGILADPRNSAVRQRLTLNYQIKPLSIEETGKYIRHRLTVAGKSEPIFADDALEEIFLFSKGYPRRINIVCDLALLSGYVREVETIGGEIIRECARELMIPEDQGKWQTGDKEAEKSEGALLASEGSGRQEAVAQTLGQSFSRGTEEPARYQEPLWKKLSYAFMVIWLLLLSGYLFYPELYRHGSDAVRGMFPSVAVRGGVGENGSVSTEAEQGALLKKAVPSKAAVVVKTRGEADEVPGKNESIETKAPVEGVKKENGGSSEPLEEPEDKEDAPPVKIVLPVKAEVEVHASDFTGKNRIIVKFITNSNEMVSDAFERLDKLALYLDQNPASLVRITGYTDSLGLEKYNRTLSRFRAGMVKSYLLGRGVDFSQLEALGKGPENPLASNDTRAGRSANRRVEVELIADRS